MNTIQILLPLQVIRDGKTFFVNVVNQDGVYAPWLSGTNLKSFENDFVVQVSFKGKWGFCLLTVRKLTWEITTREWNLEKVIFNKQVGFFYKGKEKGWFFDDGNDGSTVEIGIPLTRGVEPPVFYNVEKKKIFFVENGYLETRICSDPLEFLERMQIPSSNDSRISIFSPL